MEITPKRVSNGRVSVFLNDRASIGMTVEATGPFGQFCLNPADDKKIVLVAAGSGITPGMAMLRYIDDLCLDTRATLLYCVRTGRDIIFHAELVELQKRLKNFRYHVLLSQPDPEWPGARGHINRDFICNTVPEVKDQVFFLCGLLRSWKQDEASSRNWESSLNESDRRRLEVQALDPSRLCRAPPKADS